jgi:hypothetical protein
LALALSISYGFFQKNPSSLRLNIKLKYYTPRVADYMTNVQR